MDPFVNLEVFRSGKDFSASRKGAGKGFLTRMHTYMVDQLVFGFERSALSRAIVPETCMIGHFGSSHMFNSDMSDNFMQASKDLITRFPRRWHVWLDPQACHFLLDASRLSHVAKESSGSGGCRMVSSHGHTIHVGCVHLVCSSRHLVMSSIGSRPVHACHAMQSRKWIWSGEHAMGLIMIPPQKAGIMTMITVVGSRTVIIARTLKTAG